MAIFQKYIVPNIKSKLATNVNTILDTKVRPKSNVITIDFQYKTIHITAYTTHNAIIVPPVKLLIINPSNLIICIIADCPID